MNGSEGVLRNCGVLILMICWEEGVVNILTFTYIFK